MLPRPLVDHPLATGGADRGPQVVAADNSRAFPDRSPVLCQVRMVNELPLVPDLERLEEMIADETTVTAA